MGYDTSVREDRFDPEKCTTLEGELVCPKCGCCTLRHPKRFPDIFTQVQLVQEGREDEIKVKEIDGWECPGGCTQTYTHPKT